VLGWVRIWVRFWIWFRVWFRLGWVGFGFRLCLGLGFVALY
jgi:hypothetical protein